MTLHNLKEKNRIFVWPRPFTISSFRGTDKGSRGEHHPVRRSKHNNGGREYRMDDVGEKKQNQEDFFLTRGGRD